MHDRYLSSEIVVTDEDLRFKCVKSKNKKDFRRESRNLTIHTIPTNLKAQKELTLDSFKSSSVELAS